MAGAGGVKSFVQFARDAGLDSQQDAGQQRGVELGQGLGDGLSGAGFKEDIANPPAPNSGAPVRRTGTQSTPASSYESPRPALSRRRNLWAHRLASGR
jgi:hypothetical protein